MKKKLISLILAVVLAMCFSIPAYAANESYYFNLENTGTEMIGQQFSANKKLYINDNATIKCATTNAPGYGFLLALWTDDFYSQSTNSAWFSTNNTVKHPTYKPGKAILNRYYSIAGRIDNDYPGPYNISGVYNADYTNP